jgi:hypothetical protein
MRSMNGNQRRAVRSSWRARDLLDFALYAKALAAGATDASSTKGRREWVMGCCRFDLRSDAHVCLRRRFPVTVRWGRRLLGLRLVGAVQLVCYQDLKGVQVRGMKCWTNRSVSDHCFNSSSICLRTCLKLQGSETGSLAISG